MNHIINLLNKFKTLSNSGFLTSISLSSIFTIFIYLVGGWDVAFQSLCIVIVIDYITGIIGAVKSKKLNSKVGLWGIVKKFLYFVMVVIAVILDRIMGSDGTIRNLVIYFLIANDGLSILENSAKMGVPIPKKLIEILEQLKDSENESRTKTSK